MDVRFVLLRKMPIRLKIENHDMCSSWRFFFLSLSDNQMERAAKGPTQAEFNVPVELH